MQRTLVTQSVVTVSICAEERRMDAASYINELEWSDNMETCKLEALLGLEQGNATQSSREISNATCACLQCRTPFPILGVSRHGNGR